MKVFTRIKGFVLVAGFTVILSSSNPASAAPERIRPPEPLTAKQIYQKYNDAIVSIETDKGSGTGFFLTDGKYIITCEHVLHGAKSITVRDSEGYIVPIKKISIDPTTDSAILITAVNSSHTSFKVAESDLIDPGDTVFVIGNPLGLTRSITTGILSGKRQDGDVKLLQITAPISPGSSGSPVINEQGAAVGFVSFTFTRGQAVNMAVAILTSYQSAKRGFRTIEAFYADNGLVKPIPDSEIALSDTSNKVITQLTETIRLNPDDAEKYFRRAAVYSGLRQYDKAIADYTEAIRLDPNNAKFYASRGYSYRKIEKYDKAILDFTEAILRDSKYEYAYEARGDTYYDLKQYDNAIADYDEAIRYAPDNSFVYLELDAIYTDLDQYDKAIAHFTKIIQRKPDSAYAYSLRGRNHLLLEQYNKAILDFTNAIRCSSDNLDAYYYRATSYEITNQYDKAIADYSKYLAMEPDTYRAESVRKAIAAMRRKSTGKK